MESSSMESTFSKSPHAIILPIFSSFAIFILIVPFIWHWKLRNVGACSLIFYLSLSNLFSFLNAIIWPTEDYKNWWDGAGLCDIEAKLKWPCVTGIACATLCITRNLANVLNINRAEVSQTRTARQRKTVAEFAICFVIPLLQIILHYIIQYNRYYIMAVGGCAPSYDRSWPTIVIMFIWPLLFCLVNCCYSVIVIYRVHKYRASFSRILSSSSSNLNTSRFLRLFLMSFTVLLLYTPVNMYFFYMNVNIEWLSYDWNIIHDPDHWWIIIYLPPQGAQTFDCYCSIVMACFVFVYFGMGGDAINIYRKWMLKAGFGRIFPYLKHERDRNRIGSWSSRFGLVNKARSYFDSTRKESNATTFVASCDYTSMTRKPSCIGVEDNSQRPSPLQPNTVHGYRSSGLPDLISPTDKNTAFTIEQLNHSQPLPVLPEQPRSTKFSVPTALFHKYLHLSSKSKSSPTDQSQISSNVDLESQFPSSGGNVNLRTHIWGEPSSSENMSDRGTQNSLSREAVTVRTETRISIREEIQE